MERLSAGEVLPDFVFDTPFEKGCRLAEFAKRAGKTALVFLRYYGCTLCQLDIHQLAENYEKITADGGQLLVVLQSDPETISGQMQRKDLPFDIICDPRQTLYRKFGIKPAASMMGMMDAKTFVKVAKAIASGYKHGKYEGNEQQLPAVLVVDDTCKLQYVHYGKSAADIPSVDELAKLLAK